MNSRPPYGFDYRCRPPRALAIPEAVSKFITFLGKELTLDDFEPYDYLVVLSPLNAEAISIRQVNSGIRQYGLEHGECP